jgi:hypothetical protein|tara:strand:+ start:73 stop:1872 length:1800 start_codon:yes stop_codon:yes gene_type:complete
MAIKSKKPSINYTNRDFNSIRNDLVTYAKRYYPDKIKDFSQPSFGALMLDTVAYVGDLLSFYLDYQANESFLSTAIEYNNVVKLSRTLGYKIQTNPSSFGTLTVYVLVPTESNTVAPDENYMPILKRGSKFSSTNGTLFTLIEDVDFSDSSLERVVAQVDPNTGAPIKYAIRGYGQIVSGEIGIETIDVGEYSKFPRFQLQTRNIAEVLSIVDSENNRYYEVDHLTQDVIYIPVVNMSQNRDTVRNILKPVSVSRRFTVEKTALDTFVQFGDGTDETEIEYLDPSNVVLDTFGKTHITDNSFDPSVLNKSGKLGVAPSNTSLVVTVRLNTSENVNASANSIINVENSILSFRNPDLLSVAQINEIRTSLEVLNEEALVGDISLPTSEEIKIRAYANFATQNRAVTKQDYISTVYNMPSKFGGIKRASVSLDTNSYNQRNINLYVISEGFDNKLVVTNDTIKQNLKNWLAQYKMINDTIDIIDAKIVNFGIKYTAMGMPDVNQFIVLDDANKAIRRFYEERYLEIGEPVLITDVFAVLKNVGTVLDVTNVEFFIKSGDNYADSPFAVEEFLNADGTMLIPPSNCIFELKFPNSDIIGTIK